MGGVGHEDYYPRLCDCSRRRCDDRFWALGALHSDQGKGRSEALHTDVPNNSCRSCPNWPCPGLAPVARVGGLPVNDLRLAVPLYWLVYRHNNQISVVIEPTHSLIYARLRASLDGLDEGELTDDPKWRTTEWNDKQLRKSVRDGTSKRPQIPPVILARQPTNLSGYSLRHTIEHRHYWRTGQ